MRTLLVMFLVLAACDTPLRAKREGGLAAPQGDGASTATDPAAADPAASDPAGSTQQSPPSTPAAPARPQVSLPGDCGGQAGQLLDAGASLAAAIAKLGGSAGTLVLSQSVIQSSSINIPANVKLCFGPNGKLNVAAGAEVRIQNVAAGLRHLFAGAGRVLIKGANVKMIYPQWFGAAGDGSADDAQAFRKMLNSLTETAGVTMNLYGRTYAMTLNPGLVLPAGNGIDGNGAVILAKLTGDTEYPYMSNSRHMFSMRSNTFLRNTTLDNIPMPRSAISVLRHHIQVGEYATGRGYQNVQLDGLILKGGVSGEIGINVWGDSSNVTLRNIKFPANPNLGTAIAVQWSWDPRTLYDSAGNIRKDWSGHPHNVLVENIEIESMTTLGTSSDGQPIDLARSNCFDVCGNWGIWLSAPYNVTVRNVKMGTVATGITVYAGDFGNYMADPAVKPLVGTGIVIENVTVDKAFLRGFQVSGLPNYMHAGISGFSEYIQPVDMPVILRNSKATGVGKEARVKNTAYMAGQGFMTYYSKGVEVNNVELNNFAYGIEVYEAVSLLYIYNSKIKRSSYGGISIIGSSTLPAYNIAIKNTEILDANFEQRSWTDAAAISIGAGSSGVQVDRCHIGAVTPYRQFVGIYILGGNYHYLSNNWVSAVGPGGAAYGTLGGVSSAWYVSNNGADPGIPVYFGSSPTYY